MLGRPPIDGPLYGNQLTLRGSVGQHSGHIVRVACLIEANVAHHVIRVSEVDEDEAAF
jgi:hypothetical protein